MEVGRRVGAGSGSGCWEGMCLQRVPVAVGVSSHSGRGVLWERPKHNCGLMYMRGAQRRVM